MAESISSLFEEVCILTIATQSRGRKIATIKDDTIEYKRERIGFVVRGQTNSNLYHTNVKKLETLKKKQVGNNIGQYYRWYKIAKSIK